MFFGFYLPQHILSSMLLTPNENPRELLTLKALFGWF